MAGRRSRRRWTMVLVLGVLALVVLPLPLWAGYFGPRPAAYVMIWRPWRTRFSLGDEKVLPSWPQHDTMVAEYRDPWPGQARTPGNQVVFVTLERLRPWLPWVVTERGSGP